MYYVEFLRVFRALRVYAIVLLAVLAVAGAIRISLNPEWKDYFVSSMHPSPSAKKEVKILADGTELTTIEDQAKGRRLVQRRSPGLLDVVLYQAPKGSKVDLTTLTAPAANAPGSGRRARVLVGTTETDVNSGIRLQHTTLPNGVTVEHYVNDRRVPIDIFLVLAGFIAAVFASVIGGSLSKENDGHLELAWTKPVSREGYAFVLFAIDAAAIVTAAVLAVLAGLIAMAMYFGVPTPTATADTAGNIAMTLLFPLAWYALGQACSASLRRAGLILGLMWVAAFSSITLLTIDNDLLRFVLRVLNTFNPMAYYSTQNGHPATFNGTSINLLPATQTFDIVGLCGITIVAILASLMQWRRLEA